MRVCKPPNQPRSRDAKTPLKYFCGIHELNMGGCDGREVCFSLAGPQSVNPAE
jgi:hypothetical protein